MAGYSTLSLKNLIYCKEMDFFAYTVNNKVIVEFLEENRTQRILEDQLDEVSVTY